MIVRSLPAFCVLGFVLCPAANAEPVNPPTPVHDFNLNQNTVPSSTNPLLSPPAEVKPEPEHADSAAGEKQTLSLSLDELRAQPKILAQILEQAIAHKQWDLLAVLLPVYEQSERTDPMLILYAKAGLARHRHDYAAAVGAFHALLYVKPELDYVRLDLALTLLEDRQLNEARRQFRHLQREGSPLVELATMYIGKIDEALQTQLAVSANYTRNDNVNQASEVPTLQLWG